MLRYGTTLYFNLYVKRNIKSHNKINILNTFSTYFFILVSVDLSFHLHETNLQFCDKISFLSKFSGFEDLVVPDFGFVFPVNGNGNFSR